MDIGFVARVLGGLALSLATSFVPAAVAREDGARLHAGSVGADPLIEAAGATAAADVTFRIAPPGALPLDRALFARVDGIDLTNRAFVESRFAGESVGAALSSTAASAGSSIGLPLPQPGRLTAVLATLALGLFFFLRRIV